MRVKVWNDNKDTDWTENFKGIDVKIPSGKFIEMEFYEAHEFKGQFSPIRLRPDETQDPKSFKMIRVEQLTQEKKDELEGETDEVFPCMLCKKAYSTAAALVAHSNKVHADAVITDELAEAEIPKARRGRPAKVAEEKTA